MSKKFVADFDSVLIKPTQRAHETIGNIIIPDTGKEKPETGIIISIGPGRLTEYSGAWVSTIRQVGDEVVLPKFGVTQITIDGEDYLLTREKEIFGHYEEVTEPQWVQNGGI